MTDQQRGDSIIPGSLYKAKTPHLDAFRAGGVSFDRTYAPSPHCCPSRATLMSGLYPTRHGVWHNVNVANAISRDLNPGVRLWSQDLAAAGYRMHYAGKWHVSACDSPAERGWETNYVGHPPGRSPDESVESAKAADWRGYEASGQEGDERGEGQILRPGYPTYTHYGVGAHRNDERSVADGIEAIGRLAAADGPWCAMVSLNGPHDPYVVPQEYLDRYDLDEIELPPNFDDDMQDKPALYRRTRDRFDQLTEREHRESIRHYLAYCSYMDELFGRTLAALDETGQRQETVVLYLSDHGDYAGEHRLYCKGLPCFRSGYHVPAVMQWGRGLGEPGRVVDELTSLADFAPTVLELAGVTADRDFTGRSLVPFLRGESPEDWRDALFTQSNGNELYGIQRSVMTRDWKLVYNGFDYDELYDLATDPWETTNVVDRPQNRRIVKDLNERLWRFARDQDDTCINKYIMVALAQYGPGVAVAQEPR